MNVDTDTQYAFTRPVVGHMFTQLRRRAEGRRRGRQQEGVRPARLGQGGRGRHGRPRRRGLPEPALGRHAATADARRTTCSACPDTLLPDDARRARGSTPARRPTRSPRRTRRSPGLGRAGRAGAGRGPAVEAYAYARTGYHRGLDALRRGGLAGQGPVPWEHEPNRGFLRALAALSRAAAAIGETRGAAALRAQFLADSDPRAAREPVSPRLTRRSASGDRPSSSWGPGSRGPACARRALGRAGRARSRARPGTPRRRAGSALARGARRRQDPRAWTSARRTSRPPTRRSPTRRPPTGAARGLAEARAMRHLAGPTSVGRRPRHGGPGRVAVGGARRAALAGGGPGSPASTSRAVDVEHGRTPRAPGPRRSTASEARGRGAAMPQPQAMDLPAEPPPAGSGPMPALDRSSTPTAGPAPQRWWLARWTGARAAAATSSTGSPTTAVGAVASRPCRRPTAGRCAGRRLDDAEAGLPTGAARSSPRCSAPRRPPADADTSTTGPARSLRRRAAPQDRPVRAATSTSPGSGWRRRYWGPLLAGGAGG